MKLFTCDVNIGGMVRKFSALVEATQEDSIDECLLRAGGRVRSRTKNHVFPTHNDGRWPELEESTKKRKLNYNSLSLLINPGRGKTGERSIVQRIVREDEARKSSAAREEQVRERIIKAVFRRRPTVTLDARLSGARKRQQQAIEYIKIAARIGQRGGISNVVRFAKREVMRAKRHGAILRAFRQAKAAGHRFSQKEQRALLRQSARRYRAEAAATEMLGALFESITMKLIEGKRIEVFSASFLGPIHNEGGMTTGHGSVMKKREFMFLVEGDVDFLIELLREKMITAWHGAAPSEGLRWMAHYAAEEGIL